MVLQSLKHWKEFHSPVLFPIVKSVLAFRAVGIGRSTSATGGDGCVATKVNRCGPGFGMSRTSNGSTSEWYDQGGILVGDLQSIKYNQGMKGRWGTMRMGRLSAPYLYIVTSLIAWYICLTHNSISADDPDMDLNTQVRHIVSTTSYYIIIIGV